MTEKENTQHQFYLKNQKEISKEKKEKLGYGYNTDNFVPIRVRFP